MSARLLDWLETALWLGPGAWPRPLRVLSFAICVLIGAASACPVWADAWAQWQALQRAQHRRQVLSQAVHALPQPTAEPSSMRTSTEPESLTEERVSQVVREAGLQVLSLLPLATADSAEPEGQRLRRMHLRVQGRFAQWLAAWQRLLALEPALHWTDWHAQAQDAGDLMVDVQLRMPWPLATPSASPRAEAQAAFDARRWSQAHHEVARAHPQFTAHWERHRGGLAPLSWQDLRYVGQVRGKRGVRALLRVSSAQGVVTVHAVAVGDDLGPQLGRITRIDEDALWVQAWQRAPGGLWRREQRRVPLEGSGS
jgi:Tfp pilus assembly protein PilP